MLSKLKGFREPDYDDTDKCEFCEGIKINFTECLDITRDAQADRLWGMYTDRRNAFRGSPLKLEPPPHAHMPSTIAKRVLTSFFYHRSLSRLLQSWGHQRG